MTVPQQILIVEDEPLIAMMLEDFLEILDKGVAGTADSCADAIARVQQGGVDGAILDVNLRGGEKSTAIAEVLADAGIPFLFATGGGEEGIDERFRDRPRLHKPFSMDSVAKAIAAL
jgi:DNA-binding response OmpR family regulator